MGDATKIGTSRKSAKSFLRGLAAATCLTAASAGVAHATTTNEGAVDAFGNIFANRTQLSVGTDLVQGTINAGTDADFFEFNGLASNAPFDLTFTTDASFAHGAARTDSNAALGTPTNPPPIDFGSTPVHITGNVPSDGKIVVQVSFFEGSPNYQVSLNAPLAATVPEPATGLLTGLGAAALAVRNLKRRKLDK